MNSSGISSNTFYSIGRSLMNSSSLTKSNSSLTKSNILLNKSTTSLIKSNNDLNESLSYSDDDNITNELDLDYSMISDKNIIYIDDLTSKQYDIQLVLNNDTFIQIKIIDLSNFKYYIQNIDSKYLQDKTYISSINILYSLLYDAIIKKHKTISKIEFKLVTDNTCKLNLIYNTPYNKYIMLFELPIEKIDETIKKELIIHYLIQNNLQLTQKVNELENKLLKVELL